MDHCAHRIANLLVGNDEQCTALEAPLSGLALQFGTSALIALAGRDITASLDGRPIPAWRPFRARPGALLVVHSGCRTTIAVAGGIDVPMVLDGRGTCLRAAFGGWQGRALRRDDTLPIGTPSALGENIATDLDARQRDIADWSASTTLRPAYSDAPTVRFISGPEHLLLTDASRALLLGATFRIAPESDRMGYRLTGHPLSLTASREMVSSGVTAGTIQLPQGGVPILLMADRQTTGGYPRLGDVIAADLPLVAQLRPGDSIRFALTTLDEAHRLHRARAHDLADARRGLYLRFAQGADGSR